MNRPPATQIGRRAAASLAVLILSAACLAPGVATATPSSPSSSSGSAFTFGMRPYNDTGAGARSALDFDVSPGQSVTDRVQLTNTADEPRPFYVYAADAFNAETGGGFSLRQRTQPQTDSSKWITLPTARYTVPARSAALLPVTVTVPNDATPGDHTAAIVAEEVPSANRGKAATGLVVVQRVGTRVYLRVAGPLHPSIAIRSLSVKHDDPAVPGLAKGAVTVSFTLANTGNVRARLDRAAFSLTGLFGRSLHHATVRRDSAVSATGNALPDQILPKSTIRFTQRFVGIPFADAVTAHVTVKAADAGTGKAIEAARTASFVVIPWLVLIALVAVVALVVLRRRRRARPMPPRRGTAVDGPAYGHLDTVPGAPVRR